MDTTKTSDKVAEKKIELAKVVQQQNEAFQNLGKVLYEATLTDQTLRKTHADLYELVESLGAAVTNLQNEITELENPAKPAVVIPVENVSKDNLIDCAFCGTKVSYDYNVCTSCGINLEVSKAAVNKCASCACLVPAENKFCTNCGGQVVDASSASENSPTPEPASMVAVCTNCNNALKSGNLFCTNCGTKIEN